MRIFLVVSPPVGRVQVRSRSLTQLDTLSSTMLDTGGEPLPGEEDPKSKLRTQWHRQRRGQDAWECTPRLLVPEKPGKDEPTRPDRAPSQSQVLSRECFSVSFEVGEDDAGTVDQGEVLPATKGTYLSEALSGACERRGVNLAHVDVLLDTSPTPLPVYITETSGLGGKHLRVVARGEKSNSGSAGQRNGRNSSLKKAGGSYRNRNSRFFSASTEDPSTGSESGTSASSTTTSGKGPVGVAALKASKQRWSGFFANTRGTKMESLVEQLNNYSKRGVPRRPGVQPVRENEEALYALEDDWRSVVENSDLLSEKQQHQQTVLWELAQTEVAYIKTLKVVTDLFMACLCNLQASNILTEVDKTKLFSNIPDIYEANRYFWSEHLLRMVNVARVTKRPLDPGHLLLGFENFEQIFAPYTRYCAEQSKCQQYCRDRLNDNDLFTAYLAWCEAQKECNRLRLLDILVRPMQRLTKYSLLLRAAHKSTENEDQRTELSLMIKFVDNFVASVNAALRRSEEAARLAVAASRLDSYEVVESKDEELDKLVRTHSNLDINSVPMPGCPKDATRALLREGDLKLKDAATSKTEVHVLLLTDMLLICKPSTKKVGAGSGTTSSGGLKVIRQPFVIDRIRVHLLKESTNLGLVYLNEYGVATAVLVLSAGEPKLAKSWFESLKTAQQSFAALKAQSQGDATNVAAVTRQASMYVGDGDFDVEDNEVIPRTPRGSSRASRVSSLVHSHSGSVEMEGVSPGSGSFVQSHNQSRNVSMDTNEPPRASSVSSEEGVESASGSSHSHSRSQRGRQALLSKSPTPNTLSVRVSPYENLGQSLPNLTLATSPQTSTVSPTPPNSLLIVPEITKSKDALLSPGHRGISYPPPSPPRGSLRRAFAIPQSRNPPLMKTRNVNTSTTQIAQAASLETETVSERQKLRPLRRVPSIGDVTEDEKR
ncbi:pleckstrin homology domain-containing family G member 5 [Orussus abietinus]|uniref:pleckstrin homology domain-containing family G member 5 n=1 Tax=Orussus abietinus TaxID=222816 RepID=UPI000626C988|nr:pleckstrin homology domain-containing family G member 5 [Orussus abietinus]